MSFSFKFDERAFQREIQSAALGHVKDLSNELTKEVDQVHARLAGSSVNEIIPALRAALARHDVRPDKAQLTDWATQISEGRRITFEADNIKW